MTLEERMMMAATTGPSTALPTAMDIGYDSSLPSPSNVIAYVEKAIVERKPTKSGGGSRASSTSGSSDTWLGTFYKV